MPTSLVDLLVTCDRVLVGEELGGERRWRKLNIEKVPVGLLHNGQCRVGRFTDSDDEWCLICLVNFKDVIYCLSETQ